MASIHARTARRLRAQQHAPTSLALGVRHEFLAPRWRHQFLCRDVAEAGTRLVLGRDMIFMSWQGQPLGCRDMALRVATR